MTQPDGPATGPQPTPAPQEPAPPASPGTDWQAESRKWEQRAKENFDKAREFDKLSEAQKSAQEKQAEALAGAQRERDEAAGKLARYEVAFAAGLDAKLVKFIPNGTREEMQQAAEELLHATVLKTEPRTPRPDPSQGSHTSTSSHRDEGLAEARKRFGPKT